VSIFARACDGFVPIGAKFKNFAPAAGAKNEQIGKLKVSDETD
jgi:hypothetical protein